MWTAFGLVTVSFKDCKRYYKIISLPDAEPKME